MGLIDWFKQGVGEMMVARPDDAKSQVVWKHPDPTIPMKSQLTVESDELAVFFRDGKIVATLDPGRHTLETHDGALVFVQYTGRLHLDTGAAYTAPQFRTGASRYSWLNRVQAVAKGAWDAEAMVVTYPVIYEMR